MSYHAGEVLAETQVAAVTGFSASNVSRAKWKLLNTGASANYAILKRGDTSLEWAAAHVKANNYRTIIEVWQRVTDDQASYDALLTHVDNIQTRLEQYRKLGDTTNTVLDANLTGMSGVTEQWRNNADGPSWFKIDLYLDWSEHKNVTFAE